jgi:hypothetical protein
LSRVAVSIDALAIADWDVIQYTVSFTQPSAPNGNFSRTYQIVTTPYNARIFLLQNKYGLIESFWIDNLLEEKTVEGNVVILDADYKIDISKVESVFTARTGSKRISEMQLFKQARKQHWRGGICGDLERKNNICPTKQRLLH